MLLAVFAGLCTVHFVVALGVDAAAAAFAQDQAGRPLRSGVDDAPRLCGVEYGFDSVNAGVYGLSPQCAFEAASDDQHRSSVHLRPEREHETVMLARRSTETFR